MSDFDLDQNIPDGLEGNDDAPVIRELRKQVELRNQELRTLRPLAEKARLYERDETLKEAGLDFLTPAQRKAVIEQAGDDTSTDKLRETAASLGWQPAVDPAVTEALTGEQRIAQATAGGGTVTPPAPPNRQQQIAEAEKAGDVMAAIRLKTEWTAEQMMAQSQPR